MSIERFGISRWMKTMQAIALLAATALAGCVAPNDDPTIVARHVPPDFSVQLHVRGRSGATDLTEMTSVYVLGPSRRLRVGFGARVTFDTFPAVRRTLSPAEVERVYDFVVAHDLATITEMLPTPPATRASLGENDVLYTLAIAKGEHRTRYTTDAVERPAVVEFVRLLADVGRIEAPTPPSTRGNDP